MAIRGAKNRAILEKCIVGKMGQNMYEKASENQSCYFTAIFDGFNT